MNIRPPIKWVQIFPVSVCHLGSNNKFPVCIFNGIPENWRKTIAEGRNWRPMPVNQVIIILKPGWKFWMGNKMPSSVPYSGCYVIFIRIYIRFNCLSIRKWSISKSISNCGQCVYRLWITLHLWYSVISVNLSRIWMIFVNSMGGIGIK